MNESRSMATAYGGQTSSAQAWFAGGERVGYDPKARAIVAAGDAPLRIFLSREGDLAHAVSFLPGFPDGSIGWAKVSAAFAKRCRDRMRPPRDRSRGSHFTPETVGLINGMPTHSRWE